MSPGALYILGPGTTTRTVMERLGLPKTLLGVDAVRDGALAGADLTEARPARARRRRRPRRVIVVTVIGGQGHIFGRGNQQISPAVIRRVGPGHVIVIATQTKLLSASRAGRCSSTPATRRSTQQLSGYVKVVTGLGERTMYKVGAVGDGHRAPDACVSARPRRTTHHSLDARPIPSRCRRRLL